MSFLLQQAHNDRKAFSAQTSSKRSDTEGGRHAPSRIEDRHAHARHAIEDARLCGGITELTCAIDFGTQVDPVYDPHTHHTGDVVPKHLLALLGRQVGQDAHGALSHTQGNTATNIASKGTDRPRTLPAVQTDRVEA